MSRNGNAASAPSSHPATSRDTSPAPFPVSSVGTPAGMQFFTEAQVSKFLQVSVKQLRRWRASWRRGKPVGPPFVQTGRVIRYSEAGLRNWAAQAS